MTLDPTWITAGSNVLAGLLKPAPRTTDSLAYSQGEVTSWFDGSGWSVATGGNQGSAQAQGGARSQDSGLSPWVLLGIAFVGVLAWRK